MSTSNNEPPRALSANASSFNPPSSEQIWGAISQSFGNGGGSGNNNHNPAAESSGSRPPSSTNSGDGGHAGNGGHRSNNRSSHQSSHGTPPQGGGSGETSGLGLWNFGGFGDDARTRPAPQAGRGGMLDDSNVNLDFMGDHGNQVSISCMHKFIDVCVKCAISFLCKTSVYLMHKCNNFTIINRMEEMSPLFLPPLAISV